MKTKAQEAQPSKSITIATRLSNILRRGGIEDELQELEFEIAQAWCDTVNRGDETAIGYQVRLEDLQRSNPSHMPFRLRLAKQGLDIVFKANWVRERYVDDSGNSVPAKTYRVGKTTHATDEIGEIRAQCPERFLSLLEGAEARFVFVRAELKRLAEIGRIVGELLEMVRSIQMRLAKFT